MFMGYFIKFEIVNYFELSRLPPVDLKFEIKTIWRQLLKNDLRYICLGRRNNCHWCADILRLWSWLHATIYCIGKLSWTYINIMSSYCLIEWLDNHVVFVICCVPFVHDSKSFGVKNVCKLFPVFFNLLLFNSPSRLNENYQKQCRKHN